MTEPEETPSFPSLCPCIFKDTSHLAFAKRKISRPDRRTGISQPTPSLNRLPSFLASSTCCYFLRKSSRNAQAH